MKKNNLKIFCLLICSILSGCATIRNPLPQNLIGQAQLADMPEIREVVGVDNAQISQSMINSILHDQPGNYALDAQGNRVYAVLAISGGAANGAYGAGLLKGWAAQGTRPKFKAVTGVSTGSIIAPFVFLGKEYDHTIEDIYTKLSTKDVMRMKRPLATLFSDSFASNQPLKRTLEKYITNEIIDKIAQEHRRGRRLFTGTTYLDAQKLVVWDMGAIACRKDYDLFRKVILASAAIPIMFPPVYIQVQANGKNYDEMHVDGGTVTQVFTLFSLMHGVESLAKAQKLDSSRIKGQYYIIRNGYVQPAYKVVSGNLVSIANQSLDTIINNQGVGDLYRIYVFMQRRGNDFNLAYIPGDFRPPQKEEFDPKEMRALFDRGYQDAVGGYQWHKEPPGL
ncbi:MAG: patatin-like phospholipase family protein [Candidatus Omnitrophota bacterium]